MIKSISTQIKWLQYYAYAPLVCHSFGCCILINFGPVFAPSIWIWNQYGTSDPGLQLPFCLFRILKYFNGFLLFDLLSPVYRSLSLFLSQSISFYYRYFNSCHIRKKTINPKSADRCMNKNNEHSTNLSDGSKRIKNQNQKRQKQNCH